MPTSGTDDADAGAMPADDVLSAGAAADVPTAHAADDTRPDDDLTVDAEPATDDAAVPSTDASESSPAAGVADPPFRTPVAGESLSPSDLAAEADDRG